MTAPNTGVRIGSNANAGSGSGANSGAGAGARAGTGSGAKRATGVSTGPDSAGPGEPGRGCAGVCRDASGATRWDTTGSGAGCDDGRRTGSGDGGRLARTERSGTVTRDAILSGSSTSGEAPSAMGMSMRTASDGGTSETVIVPGGGRRGGGATGAARAVGIDRGAPLPCPRRPSRNPRHRATEPPRMARRPKEGRPRAPIMARAPRLPDTAQRGAAVDCFTLGGILDMPPEADPEADACPGRALAAAFGAVPALPPSAA